MKALAIDSCQGCPHFRSRPDYVLEDRFNFMCVHPDRRVSGEWESRRIVRDVDPPNYCPLPDYPEPKQEWE